MSEQMLDLHSKRRIERPLDLLDISKQKSILVEFNDGSSISGILECFDIHINIVIKDVQVINNSKSRFSKEKYSFLFIRGTEISLISPGK